MRGPRSARYHAVGIRALSFCEPWGRRHRPNPGPAARNRLLGLVVIPRTPAIQAAEEALSFALLALVLGKRPAVTPAAMVQCLQDFYNIDGETLIVRRTRPDDFIVRFTSVDDLERVLGSPTPEGAPFVLRWRRWSRLIMGSSGAFRYRVLVAMKGLPSHALFEDVAQAVLANAGAKVECAAPEAVSDPNDERELFVVAWCAHLDLVPDEMMIAIPEPEPEHDGGPLLFLRPWEIIHDEVPALRYLVRLRLVEFQDWHTPPPPRRPPTMTTAAVGIPIATVEIATIMGTGRASQAPAAAAGGRVRPATASTATQGSGRDRALHACHVSSARGSAWATSYAPSHRRTTPYSAPRLEAGFPRRGQHVAARCWPWKLTLSLRPTAHTLLSRPWRQTPCALRHPSAPRRKLLLLRSTPRSTPSTATRDEPMPRQAYAGG